MDEQKKNIEAAAPTRPLTLGNRVYLVSQPTPSMAASVASVIMRRLKKNSPLALIANDPAFKLLPVSAQNEAVKIAAQAQVSGEGPSGPLAMADQLLEPDVLAFAVWIGIRPNHHDATFEEIKACITEANVAQVFTDFSEAGGMEEAKGKDAQGKEVPNSPGPRPSAVSGPLPSSSPS